MARLPYPDLTTLASETQAFFRKLPALNIFRMMAGGEGLLAVVARLGNYLLYKSKLDPILREIAIIRVGVLSNASYEVFQHERIGRGLGMSDRLIAAIHRGPDDPGFDETQRLVMRFTDDVVHSVRAPDSVFQALRARLSVREMQELTITIGYYMMVSRFLENFDVDIEDGAGAQATPFAPAHKP
jgi:alkylhydroperoxidase family enzyme